MKTSDVLRLLYASSGTPVSGELIGQALGCSRASVQNLVAKLKEQGFDIESGTRTGHCLKSLNDVLNEEALALFTDIPTKVIENLNSTFDAAKLETAETIVVAHTQNVGKGRRKRAFSSTIGGAYFNYKCFPTLLPSQANLLTLAAGIAVAHTVANYGLDARIKYPNDGWIEGRKFCGILTECTMNADEILDASIGIGINVHNALPIELYDSACRLDDVLTTSINRAELIGNVVEYLKRLIAEPERIVEEYRCYDGLVGRRILLLQGAERTEADYCGIDADGYLLARKEDAKVQKITIGEVSIRPLI